MAVTIVAVTRESVTLSWEMHPEAVGYTIRRIHRLPNGDRSDVVRALVHEGLYCDPGLAPGTEYMFELTAALDEPEAGEPDMGPVADPHEELLQQRVRVRTEPETEFGDVWEFFSGFVAPTFRRRVATNGHRWCPRWASHPEVAYAMEELWHAYEAMRPAEPPAFPSKVRAEWLVMFAWPILDRLTSQEGPMWDCSCDTSDPLQDRHVELDDAEVLPLPELPALP